MDKLDFGYFILYILLCVAFFIVIFTVVPQAYGEYRSYNIMKEECDMNPDICFCDGGSCSIKSSCSYTTINDGATTGGCDYTKICDIVKKANWKEGIWEYDCE